jgi:hypothetical protein
MDLSKIVNSVGLLCDIAGAIILWRYGLPEEFSKTGAVYLTTGDTDQGEAAKARAYEWLARLGLGLLIFGFFLQLVSNFIPKTS